MKVDTHPENGTRTLIEELESELADKDAEIERLRKALEALKSIVYMARRRAHDSRSFAPPIYNNAIRKFFETGETLRRDGVDNTVWARDPADGWPEEYVTEQIATKEQSDD